MNDSHRGSPPTAWIATAAICALAAIGLGIWAFTTKSDLDDAEATVERQQRELASQQGRASREEGALRTFGERERAAYRRVRARLIKERAEAAALQRRVDQESTQLDDARQQVTAARTTTEKRDAQLRQTRAERNLAAACAKGALDSIGRFFDAASARAGARAAVDQLEALQSKCEAAVG